jgi:hypothetical protein
MVLDKQKVDVEGQYIIVKSSFENSNPIVRTSYFLNSMWINDVYRKLETYCYLSMHNVTEGQRPSSILLSQSLG